ncbi:Glutathione-dependent formaldehyde-activating enzyme [Roseovarius albus]|uniref:Glutathione-dependent formaldehyde-activating enzyme n=1 Tax=Roseovarius albus TaxID=1247867 RepID=A0A1X7A8T3_9RHOB|nr:GFA family protein [Roseovarius albus]SLN72880.1 Glutathione-dependent formaldehyde-activating enzyme [Roseovarius albus]
MTTKGRCLCGAVSFAFDGAPSWTCYCHCESCRRNCSAPVTAYLGVERTQFRWSSAPPTIYESSPGTRRLFCSTCGTPMAFEAERYPDEVHLYIASLEDPAAVHPTKHVHFEEHLPWMDIHDTLPRSAGSNAPHQEKHKNHENQD